MSGEQVQPAIDWVQIILSSIGISALVSGTVSAALNYLLTMRQLGKQRKMGLIKEKLDLLSSMIYHFDKMKYQADALAYQLGKGEQKRELYAYSETEWNTLVTDIDGKIQDRYYLLNRKILEQWVWVKNLRTNKKSSEIMPTLRKTLVEEFNQIIDKHLKDLPDIVPKIQPDIHDTSNENKTNETKSNSG